MYFIKLNITQNISIVNMLFWMQKPFWIIKAYLNLKWLIMALLLPCLWPWASYSTSLFLFPVCIKYRDNSGSILQGHYETQMRYIRKTLEQCLAYTRGSIIEYYPITVNVRIKNSQCTINKYSSTSLLWFFSSSAWLLRLNYYNILLLE